MILVMVQDSCKNYHECKCHQSLFVDKITVGAAVFWWWWLTLTLWPRFIEARRRHAQIVIYYSSVEVMPNSNPFRYDIIETYVILTTQLLFIECKLHKQNMQPSFCDIKVLKQAVWHRQSSFYAYKLIKILFFFVKTITATKNIYSMWSTTHSVSCVILPILEARVFKIYF